MSDSNPPTQVTIQLDPDLRPQLDAYCAETNRNLSDAINYLLAQSPELVSHLDAAKARTDREG